jgi:hypothetical protein
VPQHSELCEHRTPEEKQLVPSQTPLELQVRVPQQSAELEQRRPAGEQATVTFGSTGGGLKSSPCLKSQAVEAATKSTQSHCGARRDLIVSLV